MIKHVYNSFVAKERIDTWTSFLWRQHSGAPLRDHFVRRPSVCLSVHHTFSLLITFLPSEVRLSYLACVFLMTTPFQWYHRFWAHDLDRDLWPTLGKFRLSHFWFAYNSFTFRGRAFIFGMWVPYDNTFPMLPYILSTWPWPWPLTYIGKIFTLHILPYHYT